MSRPGPFHEVDAPSREYSDVRSANKSRKRGRDQYHKYLKYGSVHREQANNPHYTVKDRFYWPAGFEGCEVRERLSKRDFYKLARDAQICHHHRPCPGKKEKSQIHHVEHKRGTDYAKHQARYWSNTFQDLSAPYWIWTQSFEHGVWPLHSRDLLDSVYFDPAFANDFDAVEVDEAVNGVDHDTQPTQSIGHDGENPLVAISNANETAAEPMRPLHEGHGGYGAHGFAAASDTDDWSDVDSFISWDDFSHIDSDIASEGADDISSQWFDIEDDLWHHHS